MDFEKVLLAVCPHGKREHIIGFAASMTWMVSYAELSTPRRLGVFIGQCAHESDGFRTMSEYASGKAYNGRKDLGNVLPGDGPRYKGRGAIELTGRTNYRAAGKALGVDLEGKPEQAATWPLAGMVSAWFWRTKGLNSYVDTSSDEVAIKASTHRINGGYNGLAQRTRYIKAAWAALGDLKGALTDAAKKETRAAKNKAASAGAVSTSAAIAGATPALRPGSAHGPDYAALGQFGEWALILGGVALLALTAWLVIKIRAHRRAAAALTRAAEGI